MRQLGVVACSCRHCLGQRVCVHQQRLHAAVQLRCVACISSVACLGSVVTTEVTPPINAFPSWSSSCFTGLLTAPDMPQIAPGEAKLDLRVVTTPAALLWQ